MKLKSKNSYLHLVYVILYITAIYLLFLSIKEYLIYPNCSLIAGWLWIAGYFCSWYFYILNQVLHLLILLFLWITLIPYIVNKLKLTKQKKYIMIIYYLFIGLMFIILVNNVYTSLSLIEIQSNLQQNLIK